MTTNAAVIEQEVPSIAHLERLNTDLANWQEVFNTSPDKMREAILANNGAEFARLSTLFGQAQTKIAEIEKKIRAATGTTVNAAKAEAAIEVFDKAMAEFLASEASGVSALVEDAKTVGVMIRFVERKRNESGGKMVAVRNAIPRVERIGGFGTKTELTATANPDRLKGRYSRGSLGNEILPAGKVLERFAPQYKLPEKYRTLDSATKSGYLKQIVAGEKLVAVLKDGSTVKASK